MKFVGKVGFYLGTKETKKNVYQPDILERPYTGDLIQQDQRFQSGEHQNDEFHLSSRISILSDLYLQQNWTSIRYILWNGVKWKATSVKIEYPRIIITLGGVWNG